MSRFKLNGTCPVSRVQAAARALLTAEAVRERAHAMLALGLAGKLIHFTIDLDRLPAAADFVAAVIRENYPALAVPFHARWRHFVLDGRDLWAELAARTRWRDAASKARAAFDLAIVSVLLDAGAGAAWRYRDVATGAEIGRSEGLALASFRMFEAGVFSADPDDPYRADAKRLAAFTADHLAAGFQASDANPLTGLEGRAALVARLGATVAADPAVFGHPPRPGGLFDRLAQPALPAPQILALLLERLGAIWPGRITLGGVALGDTWRHPALSDSAVAFSRGEPTSTSPENTSARADATTGLIPFHKLSQWLAYSLIEPLQAAGVTVTQIDGLTGLAEYRNGGLFVDAGVITLRDATAASVPHAVDSTLVVEWRALTVALLDRIAPLVRERLGVSAAAFPLACVLEGGTWAAGRRLAQKRASGAPPIRVDSDGTVF